MAPTFETANAADLDVIRALVSAGGLPVDDVDEHISEFLLAKQQGATIGTVALGALLARRARYHGRQGRQERALHSLPRLVEGRYSANLTTWSALMARTVP